MARMSSPLGHLGDRLTEAVGGPARRRVVLLLAAVLSLESADTGTVGALAAQLERAFRIGNTELGLLITVSSLVGALASLPMGVVTDRSKRARALTVSVALWAAGMITSGLATSYLMLLLTRLTLGVTIAAAGPMVASLTGDLFPAKERTRIYGMILTGQLVGGGFGLLFSADIGAVVGWRAPFFILAVPSLLLAYCLYRLLPEPARGGQSWLRPGDEEIKPVEESEPVAGTATGAGRAGGGGHRDSADAGAAAAPVEDSRAPDMGPWDPLDVRP